MSTGTKVELNSLRRDVFLMTQADQRSNISSIEARRILAVLEDCRSRIEYALILPQLGDFLEGREDLDEEIQAAYAEFASHQRAISTMITADGEPKPGRQLELEEETVLYKDYSRDLIRVMRRHPDYFTPLLQQIGNSGGSSVKLIQMMKDLTEMMNLTFSTPVESEQRQKRMLQEIQQRKNSNKEFIADLKTREAAIVRERDQKIRAKEDLLDEIKTQLQTAKAGEAQHQTEDENNQDAQNEESMRVQIAQFKATISAQQKTNSDDENRNRRILRREEESLQTLIRTYDDEMSDLTRQIEIASEEADKREKILQDLQSEYYEIEGLRQPLKHEEQVKTERTNRANKMNQDMIAAVVKLQIEIRRYLKTAPKYQRRTRRRGSRRARR